jgi:16S rRNA (guanine527-N7)-methyltransferase
MNILNFLSQGLNSLDINIDTKQQQQILDYLALLKKWNRVYNLTAIPDEQMIPKHVLDSLAVLPHICGTRILDVGTGAGLPGLLLAIARPDW